MKTNGSRDKSWSPGRVCRDQPNELSVVNDHVSSQDCPGSYPGDPDEKTRRRDGIFPKLNRFRSRLICRTVNKPAESFVLVHVSPQLTSYRYAQWNLPCLFRGAVFDISDS